MRLSESNFGRTYITLQQYTTHWHDRCEALSFKMQTRQDAIAGFEDTLAHSELLKLLLICWMDRIGAMRCMFCTFTIILNDDN
jgi:hypothetical protein